jgi:predicted AAA+ superfamily ATPase
VKRQQIAPKKVYSIDTGMVNTIGFTFSPNTGKLLENLVFLALRRMTKDIYYYLSPSGYEVDFYLPESHQLVQVSHNLNQPLIRERETRAIAEAGRLLNLTQGLILSDVDAKLVEIEGITVEIRSVSKWLLTL